METMILNGQLFQVEQGEVLRDGKIYWYFTKLNEDGSTDKSFVDPDDGYDFIHIRRECTEQDKKEGYTKGGALWEGVNEMLEAVNNGQYYIG